MKYWRVIDAVSQALLAIVTATNRVEAYRIGKQLFGETNIRIADSDTPNFSLLIHTNLEKLSIG